MTDQLVRLSRWVFFVDYDDYVEVHHVLSGGVWRTERDTAGRLKVWAGFRPLVVEMNDWGERGVLVAPYTEPLFVTNGAPEAALESDWQAWYWCREVEAEREYRWLGEVVLKMPSDLFFYQELIAARGVKRVLEIGSGLGGGVWFFASVLNMCGGGHVIGVERDPPARVPAFERFSNVRVDFVEGDAREADVFESVEAILSQFDLVVIDASPAPSDKLTLLGQWAPLVAPGGLAVVEDVSSPACRVVESQLIRKLDDFVILRHDFMFSAEARRHPLLKCAGAVFARQA